MSDLHLLAPGLPEEPRSRAGRSVALAVALVLVTAAVVWLLMNLLQETRAEARTEAALGRSAHAAGDCDAADRHLKSALDSGTTAFLDPPVDRADLRAEITACEDLERARHLVGREEYGKAIGWFGDYLGSGSALYANALEEQADARIALGQDLEARQAELRAVRQYATVMTDAPGTSQEQQAEKRIWALYAKDVEARKQQSPCRRTRPARVWTGLGGEPLQQVRQEAHHTLSWSLLRCGEERIARGQRAARDARYAPKTFVAARSPLTEASKKYPDTKPGRLAAEHLETLPAVKARASAKATEVAEERRRVAKLRNQVKRALDGGGHLDRPRRTGDGGAGTLRLTVRNATGHGLYAVWSGKETESTTIPGGGKKCRTARATTLTLPAGGYSFAVRAKDGWAAATWSFDSKSFTTCIR
ncbi:hypothetical protein GCM10028784_15260 [Myceligenerans cantabricum]